MTYNPNAQIELADTRSRDSFGRLRTSSPTGIFDAQMTYDLQPLLFEKKINGLNAAVEHDSTNRNALMTFTNRYPITLDQAGAVRALGTVSLIAQGVGGTSGVYVSLKWIEIR